MILLISISLAIVLLVMGFLRFRKGLEKGALGGGYVNLFLAGSCLYGVLNDLYFILLGNYDCVNLRIYCRDLDTIDLFFLAIVFGSSFYHLRKPIKQWFSRIT
jgi:hypothetical protein